MAVTINIYFVQMDPSKSKRKFSSFFKSLVIELDKDLYGPDNHLVEWRRTPTTQETDGFQVKRPGENFDLPIALPNHHQVIFYILVSRPQNIQGRSKYQALDYQKQDYSRFQMVKKRLVCKWSKFLMGSEIRKPYHLKSGPMATILSKKRLKSGQNVQILNGPVFKWLELQ